MLSMLAEVRFLSWVLLLLSLMEDSTLPSYAALPNKSVELPPYLKNTVNICMHGEWFEENKTCVCDEDWITSVQQDVLNPRYIWCNVSVIKDNSTDTDSSGYLGFSLAKIVRNPLFGLVGLALVFFLLAGCCNMCIMRQFMGGRRSGSNDTGDNRRPDETYVGNNNNTQQQQQQQQQVHDHLQPTAMVPSQSYALTPPLTIGSIPPNYPMQSSGPLQMYSGNNLNNTQQNYSPSEPFSMFAASSVAQPLPPGYIPQQHILNSMLSLQRSMCVPSGSAAITGTGTGYHSAIHPIEQEREMTGPSPGKFQS
ncbi:hypothetical protein, conserved [Trypanosoma brucei gambiense DAL972]|uniref:T. brucei spp.-specific protein n=1 Tax=Trypanosoma brucei gambiense (strain MHOM/CI/86/DAL972) TaxID=679716 RepID=D0A652_TRYB9|nr:hypothetical protein, conserved [Trypanosoma brucei gambiense DAL972]CBH17153.1 hypothetical protein, conserved [Trypanosoma brucei gambiense DAL972]|eukprot:XP_011779417.1 hypothetical protein, conserved [Trypanosoma brucei gambiense DAL972]